MQLYRHRVRQDVRELGAILGDVIADQRSDDALHTVETLRTTAIDYRRGGQSNRDPLFEALEDADAERALDIVRAFTTYFELINSNEERERVRALREQNRPASPTRDSKNWRRYWQLSIRRPPSKSLRTYSSSRRLPHTQRKHGARQSKRSFKSLPTTSKRSISDS